MRAYRIPPEKYWSAFGKAYHGPARQARTVEKSLSGFPQKDAVVNIEAAGSLFNRLQAPWIPDICERYNIGGLKILGSQFAPQPDELAHFFSHLLSPSIQNNHFRYPGVLGAGIKSGYVALSERTGGAKRVFRNIGRLMNALCSTSLDMLGETKTMIYSNSFSGKVSFILDDTEVFPARFSVDCTEEVTSIIVDTGIDLSHLTGRLIQALGSWDLKFSSGLSTKHVWMNGADRETILDVMLGVEKPLRPVGINRSVLSGSGKMRSVVLHEISENIQKITEDYSYLNNFMRVLMLMNLGKLRWIESEFINKALISSSS